MSKQKGRTVSRPILSCSIARRIAIKSSNKLKDASTALTHHFETYGTTISKAVAASTSLSAALSQIRKTSTKGSSSNGEYLQRVRELTI